MSDRDRETPIPRGTSAATKISASLGIVAAMVLAVLVNVFVSRHYKRWDWTRGGIYTLSDATAQTLHGLEEPIHVYVLLPSGDPLTLSVEALLDALTLTTVYERLVAHHGWSADDYEAWLAGALRRDIGDSTQPIGREGRR